MTKSPTIKPATIKPPTIKPPNIKPQNIKPPSHISADAKRWFAEVLEGFELESHELKLLILACECWDRATLARQTIAKEGITYTDRLGNIRKHPAVSIAEAATTGARLTRELSLIDTTPDENRPPPIKSNRGH